MAIQPGLGFGTISLTPRTVNGSVTPGNSVVHVLDVPSSLFPNGNLPVVNLSLRGAKNVEVALHPDTNGNGVFDPTQDGFITADSNATSTNVTLDASVTAQVFTPGRYFAVVANAPGFTNSGLYTLQASSTPLRQPPNLASRELFVGTGNLTSDITTQRRFLDRFNNTSNTHSFSLGSSDVTITLFGLDADYDLRVVRDANNNGVVDNGEVVASSARGGTQNDSVTITAPGNYLAQVYQFANASTNYQLTFDVL